MDKTTTKGSGVTKGSYNTMFVIGGITAGATAALAIYNVWMTNKSTSRTASDRPTRAQYSAARSINIFGTVVSFILLGLMTFLFVGYHANVFTIADVGSAEDVSRFLSRTEGQRAAIGGAGVLGGGSLSGI